MVIQITGPGGAVHSGGTSSSPDKTISSSDYTPGASISSSRKFQATMPSSIAGSWKIDYLIYDQAGSGSVYTEYYAFTYSFSVPTGSVSLTATPSSSLLTSVDSTDYNSSYTNDSITRTHSIHPAPGAVDALGVAIPDPADSGSSATITYTGITTGLWTSTISTVGVWSDGDVVAGSTTNSTKHYVHATVAGGGSSNINSDVGLCDVYCCLKALNDRYEQAKCKNKELAEDYKAKIEDVTRLVTLYIQAVSCGLTGDASCYITDIKNISECGTECSCYGEGDIPANIPIVSKTSSNHTKIESASARLAVTSSGSGTSADPVVYSMDLGASVSADVNYTAQNIDNVNRRLGVMEESVDGLLKDFNNLTGSPERLSLNIIHEFTGSDLQVTKTQTYLTGSRFYSLNDNKITLTSLNKNESDWPSFNNSIEIGNFNDSKWRSTNFYVEARIISKAMSDIEIEVYSIDKKDNQGYGAFKYRFRDKKEGYILTNNNLSKYGAINVSFDLISESII